MLNNLTSPCRHNNLIVISLAPASIIQGGATVLNNLTSSCRHNNLIVISLAPAGIIRGGMTGLNKQLFQALVQIGTVPGTDPDRKLSLV